jgi:hypothetical protein
MELTISRENVYRLRDIRKRLYVLFNCVDDDYTSVRIGKVVDELDLILDCRTEVV